MRQNYFDKFKKKIILTVLLKINKNTPSGFKHIDSDVGMWVVRWRQHAKKGEYSAKEGTMDLLQSRRSKGFVALKREGGVVSANSRISWSEV